MVNQLGCVVTKPNQTSRFFTTRFCPPSTQLTADCAVCSDGYAESLSYTCSSCSNRKASVVAMVALPITVVFGIVFLGYMVSKESDARPRPVGHFHRLKRLLPLQSLKIVIVVWQILTEVSQRLKAWCSIQQIVIGRTLN